MSITCSRVQNNDTVTVFAISNVTSIHFKKNLEALVKVNVNVDVWTI